MKIKINEKVKTAVLTHDDNYVGTIWYNECFIDNQYIRFFVHGNNSCACSFSRKNAEYEFVNQ